MCVVGNIVVHIERRVRESVSGVLPEGVFRYERVVVVLCTSLYSGVGVVSSRIGRNSDLIIVKSLQ